MSVVAFLLGLAGSLHCLAMCGPLALVFPGGNRRWPSLLTGRVIYNLGRVLTYTLLGSVIGWLGRHAALAGFQQALSLGLGVFILIILLGLHGKSRIPIAHTLVERVQGGVARLLHHPGIGILFPIGILNGLLPCGLVYVALAGAAVQSTSVNGAVFMFSFGMGTFPMMLAVSLGATRVRQVNRVWAKRAMPFAALTVAAFLLVRGLGLGIPYLSPDLSAPETCCHAE
jgi:uncharacterized protein